MGDHMVEKGAATVLIIKVKIKVVNQDHGIMIRIVVTDRVVRTIRDTRTILLPVCQIGPFPVADPGQNRRIVCPRGSRK